MKHTVITVKLFAIVIAVALPIHANGADSADALTVLTTVGYLTGAADGCKVVSKESNQLSSGMALAIGRGNYGDPAKAHTLFNNARQEGIKSGADGKVKCEMVGNNIKQYTRSLLSNAPRTAQPYSLTPWQ